MYTFTAIEKTQDDAKALYDLLQSRGQDHSISHGALPEYEGHLDFVLNHPYRVWYFVKQDEQVIGTVYLAQDNALGLFLMQPSAAGVNAVLGWVQSEHNPLPPIKSVRAGHFFVNVSPKNTALIDALEECGLDVLQVSYKV